MAKWCCWSGRLQRHLSITARAAQRFDVRRSLIEYYPFSICRRQKRLLYLPVHMVGLTVSNVTDFHAFPPTNSKNTKQADFFCLIFYKKKMVGFFLFWWNDSWEWFHDHSVFVLFFRQMVAFLSCSFCWSINHIWILMWKSIFFKSQVLWHFDV